MDNDLVKRLAWSGLLAGFGALATHGHDPRRRRRFTGASSGKIRRSERRRRTPTDRRSPHDQQTRAHPAGSAMPEGGIPATERPEALVGAAFAGGLVARPDPEEDLAADPDQQPRRSRSATPSPRSARRRRCSSARRSSSPRPRSRSKATTLGKGAAVAAAAGVFALFGLIFFLHILAWFFVVGCRYDDVFWGFLIVDGPPVRLRRRSPGCIGIRWIKKGAPPTPDMAIDEAKLIKETVSD